VCSYSYEAYMSTINFIYERNKKKNKNNSFESLETINEEQLTLMT